MGNREVFEKYPTAENRIEFLFPTLATPTVWMRDGDPTGGNGEGA